MTEQWREWFFAYLDGRGTPVERKRVETLLAENPQARELWEETKSLFAGIQSSKPLELQVPADFRRNIMHRLQAHPTGSGKGTGTGSSHFGWHKAISWLVAGTVLTVLVGTMVYLDHKKQIQARQKKSELSNSVVSVEPLARTDGNLLKALPTLSVTQQGVNPNSILSQSEKKTGAQAAGVLTGDVYTRGTVTRSNTGKTYKPVLKSGLTEVQPHRALQPVNLERSTEWSQEGVAQALHRSSSKPVDSPAQVLGLSRKYNLNPGLIIAARGAFPAANLDSLSETMRDNLNHTQGQSEDQRLLGVLKALKADPAQLEQWKRVLRQK